MSIETFDTRFGRKAQELIDRSIEDLKTTVAAGLLEPGQYKFESGKINGLRLALTLMDQAMTEIMKN